MTLQELADIALRHATAMADAMLAAVVAKAYETGESVDVARRRGRARVRKSYDRSLDPFRSDALECMRQTHGVTWRDGQP